ncbi:MAG: alpha/beta hydrolase [Clostridia bacterium]|nr:alpha/beta hydrolase [Clostridia bacterium]
MKYEKIQLLPGRDHVTLEFFGHNDTAEKRDAILVIPGGGYGAVCSDREGYPIAQAYMMQELNAFVLHYSVSGQIKSPIDPLYEAALAMIHIRKNADKYNICPERVFTVGFSAGGHLAGSLANLWNREDLHALLGEDASLVRPTGAVLCYPVTLGVPEVGCGMTFKNLLKESFPDQNAVDSFSLEKNVGAHSSPVFFLHTFDDALVPVENSLRLGLAYEDAGIPFEMHIYPHAPHGIALANKITWSGNPDFVNSAIARWVEDSAVWMKGIQ